jgi:hypothetical protein
MGLIFMPKAVADIAASVTRHQNDGEIVHRIVVSPNLHHQIIEEVWQYDREIIYTADSLWFIPIKVSETLSGNDFYLDTEKGRYTHD